MVDVKQRFVALCLQVLTRNNKAAMVMVDAGGLDALTFVAAEGTSDRARASACKAIQRLAATPGTEHAVRRSKAARFLTTEVGLLYTLEAVKTAGETVRHQALRVSSI